MRVDSESVSCPTPSVDRRTRFLSHTASKGSGDEAMERRATERRTKNKERNSGAFPTPTTTPDRGWNLERERIYWPKLGGPLRLGFEPTAGDFAGRPRDRPVAGRSPCCLPCLLGWRGSLSLGRSHMIVLLGEHGIVFLRLALIEYGLNLGGSRLVNGAHLAASIVLR